MLYVDHAAGAWPCLFPVASMPFWSNPSAEHAMGREARAVLEEARAKVAWSLNADPSQLFFTSGGTESINTVLQGRNWHTVVTTRIEHHAVLHTLQFLTQREGSHTTTVEFVPTDSVGRVAIPDVIAACPAQGPVLVSLAFINNEIGVVLDVPALSAAIRAANRNRTEENRIWFHTDADQLFSYANLFISSPSKIAGVVQVPGHLPLDLQRLDVDYLSLSAHKFHGPTGVGLLFVREPYSIRPLLWGGSQQQRMRPGTESVGLSLALTEALLDANDPVLLEQRARHYEWIQHRVWQALAPFVASGRIVATGPTERAAYHISFCVRGGHRKTLLALLEADGVLVSGGSACSSRSTLPSHVLVSLNVPPEYIHGCIRLSFSHTNTREDIDTALIPALIRLLSADD